MTPASKLQEHLKKRVQNSSGTYRKVCWTGRNGCPDCLIWWKWPNAAFVEIKAGKDRFSKVQSNEVRRMIEDGVPVYTARTIEEIDRIVEIVRKGIATSDCMD